MRTRLLLLLVASLTTGLAADTSLTIYNDNFAVVRGSLPLDLKSGVTDARYNEITFELEPSSVILRDPAGKAQFQILEQSYRADPVSQALMLSLFEGQTIDFRVVENEKVTIVPGKIIRSGYDPTQGREERARSEPLIEVEGKLRFDLPGIPLFPKLADDTVLKPELSWKINSAQEAKLQAEIAYVTANLNWKADYNVVSPEGPGAAQLIGWITAENKSGKKFENVRTQLVAGDVNKTPMERAPAAAMRGAVASSEYAVTEQALDEYHLYTLPHPLTLRDRETKQVEFVRSEKLAATQLYLCDPYGPEGNRPFFEGVPQLDPRFGRMEKIKVGVISEFKNSEENGLGVALPKGQWRFYRRDKEGQLQFTGENEVDHTPRDEKVRIFTGYAFDLVSERRQTDFTINQRQRTTEEAFEVKVRNRKKVPVEVRVNEYLLRWKSWEMVLHSMPFNKLDAHRIEFVVPLQPDEEKTVVYRVRYTELPPQPM